MSKTEKFYIEGLRKEFERYRDDAAASIMMQYMRGMFSFFGIQSQQRRAIGNAYMKMNPARDLKEAGKLVKLLWKEPEREMQYFAMDLYGKFKNKLQEDDITLIEYMIVNKSWWDTVDFVASHLAGAWMKKFNNEAGKTTLRWNRSDNMWLQRSSLLYQLKYKDKTNIKQLQDYIRHLQNSDEFFIRKAIGWILREYSKTDPAFVKRYVKTAPISALSKREAMKVLHRKEV